MNNSILTFFYRFLIIVVFRYRGLPAEHSVRQQV